MANLVSSVISENAPNGPERRRVTELHTDVVGKEYTERYSSPTVWDFDLELANHAISLEASIPVSEAQKAAGIADSQSVDVAPTYQTQAEYDRRTLGFLMTETDSKVFLDALYFWQAVEARGGANANARAAYLGVSRANYDLVANRFGDVQGSATFINDSKGQIWTDIPEEFQ